MEGMISTVALLCLVWSSVGALQVNIPQDQYEFARGDNITLPCTFTPASGPTPKLVVVSWSAEAATANAKETQIITYYFPSGTTDINSKYEGRVSLDIDYASGKANMKLSSITLADNKVFECRLLIPGDDEGKPADTARLVVLVAPSKPICKIQGKAEYGQNINLTCVSEEGSPTPTYNWDSRDVRNTPRLAPHPRTTDKGGILSLYNISKDTSGFYTCTSRNKIRSATCNITLAVMPPSMTFGSTAIIAIAVSVVALIALIVIIYCCCRHRKKKREEEYAMGVRGEEFHDKEPPKNGKSRQADREEDPNIDRDPNEERSERGYDSRRDYDDRRSDYDDRRSDYNDRRSDYDDRRSDYDNRRSDYDDRRSDYNDRRDKYSDRNERYDDEPSSNDRRDRRNDDGAIYDEPYGDDRDHDRPPVPNNKPQRRDYDD
nr:PREDICTED: cell surface A33 antigen [Paralichthys olivaceus]